jgi:hypothetical protein
MTSRDVRTVIVNGSIVMRDRHFPWDTAEVYPTARKEAQKLWNRMDAL